MRAPRGAGGVGDVRTSVTVWIIDPEVDDRFDDVRLVLFDSYDQQRMPPVPLPIPIGARPGRLSTLPLSAELLIEMVAAGGDVATILPSWIVAPYLHTHDLVSIQVGSTPHARTWYCATRHGPQPQIVDVFVAVLAGQLGAPRQPA